METDTGLINPLGQTYTSVQVAAYLGCSERKVWNLAREHKVGLRLGGPIGWRFTDTDIAKLVEALRPAAPVDRRRRRRRT